MLLSNCPRLLVIQPLFVLFAAWLPSTVSQTLSDDQVALVKQRLAEGATHSWELGTRAQALLELDAPSFSVLTSGAPVPPPTSLNSSATASLSDVFSIAQKVVSGLSNISSSSGVGQPLVNGDGSAGDPASIGVAVLLANWTGVGGDDYAGAAQDQIEYLFGSSVPKTPDGAISHRVSQVQLWSDSVYMVPPFLAYYGVTTNNRSMVQEAYTQIKLYRNYLNDPNAKGLWKHILLGQSGNDEGHWSTGNGWAAAGMLRVMATMKNSQYAGSFKSEIKDLGQWAFDIQTAMYPFLQPNDLFKNYPDNATDPSNFDDAASTALLASTVYRLALLTGNHKFIPQAERSRQALFANNATSSPQGFSSPSSSSSLALRPSVSRSAFASASRSSDSSSSTSSSSTASATPSSTAFPTAQHFTSDGWLTPVVNPDNFGVQGSQSPESEAFVLMLHSAWRDWAAAGSQGINGASRHAASTVGTLAMGLLIATAVVVWL
ncbi:hypothetical protein BV25DRAFT_1819734 [Artomyces pyxidatus]|uniref:Uncharacterized protein n=1 Tax=Artomyces pyxidatus TaxID=48021 RepID=A0ACB8TG87_9AGAM|nr:hypothetical protein BV25DRAFT_1819734 [Artomyces pyxidatus]